MKILVLDIYKLLYRATKKHMLSLIISLVYITILDMIFLQGLSVLMPANSFAKIVRLLTTPPTNIITAALVFLLNVWMMSPYKNIRKEKSQPINYWSIVMYTLVALIIFVYLNFGNRFFD